MALIPPRVVGPVSVCNNSILVEGQLTGATVEVFSNGAPVAQLGRRLCRSDLSDRTYWREFQSARHQGDSRQRDTEQHRNGHLLTCRQVTPA